MKKIVSSLFILGVFFFSGCQSQNEDSPNDQESSRNISETVISSTTATSESSEEIALPSEIHKMAYYEDSSFIPPEELVIEETEYNGKMVNAVNLLPEEDGYLRAYFDDDENVLGYSLATYSWSHLNQFFDALGEYRGVLNKVYNMSEADAHEVYLSDPYIYDITYTHEPEDTTKAFVIEVTPA